MTKLLFMTFVFLSFVVLFTWGRKADRTTKIPSVLGSRRLLGKLNETGTIKTVQSSIKIRKPKTTPAIKPITEPTAAVPKIMKGSRTKRQMFGGTFMGTGMGMGMGMGMGIPMGGMATSQVSMPLGMMGPVVEDTVTVEDFVG